MGRTTTMPVPSVRRRIVAFGEKLQLARLRRHLTATQVAERAGISRKTLSAIEHGDPGISIGLYCNVLFILGLDGDLDVLAEDDVLGRKLQDAGLIAPRRVRRKITPVAKSEEAS
jgi:transcriptional regulator with XRE-family HTH domain